jgi:hypothetical protein
VGSSRDTVVESRRTNGGKTETTSLASFITGVRRVSEKLPSKFVEIGQSLPSYPRINWKS